MSNLAGLGFDASQVEPDVGFEAIPAGDYDAVIVSSEVKASSTGGQYLKLELQILNGPYQNRKVFTNLNLWNSSEDAVKIARANLSAICRAVNVLTPQDSSQLHNKPLRIKVVVKQDPQYGPRNEIKGFKPRQAGGTLPTPPAGVDPNAAMSQPPVSRQSQPVGNSTQPAWG